jgi:hypothetical protein
MPRALLKTAPEETFDDVRDLQFQTRPAARKRREYVRLQREVVLALVRLRKAANLTQRELAARALWDTGYVSRLESVNGNPDLLTIVRYAAACGVATGLAFGEARSSGFHIAEVVHLASAPMHASHGAAVAGTAVASDAVAAE